MMSWIIQIGLFSLLSLRQLIYAWMPKGRLQLSFLCLNLRLPVLGNKPVMIINQKQFCFVFVFSSQPNLKSKSTSYLPFHSIILHSCTFFVCDYRLACSTWNVFALFHPLCSVLASSTALMHSTPLTETESLFCQNLFVNTVFLCLWL